MIEPKIPTANIRRAAMKPIQRISVLLDVSSPLPWLVVRILASGSLPTGVVIPDVCLFCWAVADTSLTSLANGYGLGGMFDAEFNSSLPSAALGGGIKVAVGSAG